MNVERHPAEPVSVERNEGTATGDHVSVSGEEMQNKLENLSNCHSKATEIYDSQTDTKFDRLSLATITERMSVRDFGVQYDR